MRRRREGLRALLLDAYGTLFHYERERLFPVFQAIVQGQALPVASEALLQAWARYEASFRATRVSQKGGQWRAEPFRSYQSAWAECFRRAFHDLKIEGDKERAVRVLAEDLAHREAYREVAVALRALRSRVPVVLVSNADAAFLLGTLAHNGLHFETVVYSEAEEVYKPHPRLFQRALERLGIEPEQALFAGDSPTEDVVGATSVGIPTVWVNRSLADWPLSDAHPTFEVPDLLGLVDIVAVKTRGFF
ncbi:MAG: HAD family hydrolase [Chloroflexi bacterium]|nr:HAD family hydrolase [Chloroflexota bacterium]